MTTPTLTSAPEAKKGFSIGVHCPGCGGKLQLAENFWVLTCEHCNSPLRVQMPDIPPAFMAQAKFNLREARFSMDRFLKERDLPLTGPELETRCLYYPYWKIDGVLLRVRNRIETRSTSSDLYGAEGGEVESEWEVRKTETTAVPHSATISAGPRVEGLPYSVGMRADYVPLTPYASNKIESNFDSLPVLNDLNSALGHAIKSVDKLGAAVQADFGRNRTELLNPQAFIVYFPFAVVECHSPQYYRFVIDGLTGRVITFNDTESESSDPAGELESSTMTFGNLSVKFHRCYNCGDDLPTGRSYIYVCDNCHAVNMLETDCSQVRQISVVEDSSTGNPLFPFWVFNLEGENREDIIRLFGGLDQAERLCVPAFTMQNYEAAFRLCQRMTAALNRFETVGVSEYNTRFKSVTLSQADARMLGEVLIYRARTARQPHLTAREIDLNPVSAEIVYLPFREEHYFFVDSILEAITFEKNLVKL